MGNNKSFLAKSPGAKLTVNLQIILEISLDFIVITLITGDCTHTHTNTFRHMTMIDVGKVKCK
jgi:hypothetical protein